MIIAIENSDFEMFLASTCYYVRKLDSAPTLIGLSLFCQDSY